MKPSVWAEIIGGDALGRGHEPALCWWLPDGSGGAARLPAAHRRRPRHRPGGRPGPVVRPAAGLRPVPALGRGARQGVDRPGRERVERAGPARELACWTRRTGRRGGSAWRTTNGRRRGPGPRRGPARRRGLGPRRGPGRHGSRPAAGSRPAYWLRTTFDAPPADRARLYITALGLYEAFLDGRRVGDVELAPGYTQYRARVQYQAYDVTPLVPPGRHVLAVLLADGWYRGQVGLPRAADQYGRDLALRAQLEVRTGAGWQVVAGTDPGWRVARSHITAADLIAGQREDHRGRQAEVHDVRGSTTGRGAARWRATSRSRSSGRSRRRSGGSRRSGR